MCRKIQFFSFSFFDGPRDPLKCVAPPPKMVPSYSLVIWLPKTPKSHQSPVAPSSRKLWFSEDTQFWPKYSNGPGVAKSWQISKVTIRCHKRCLKLSWDQIWQKNSNGKCPKLPIRSAHSLRYIGGLSVNLNHLKIRVSSGKTLRKGGHFIGKRGQKEDFFKT